MVPEKGFVSDLSGVCFLCNYTEKNVQYVLKNRSQDIGEVN